MAHRGKLSQLPWPSICEKTKLHSVKKLQFSTAGVALSYASNIQKIINLFSFQKCNLSISCIVIIYNCAVYDGNS